MSYSISFYLRRRKTIYCQLEVNGFTLPRSTKKNVLNPELWDGRYYRDPISNEVNEFLQNYHDELDEICQAMDHDDSFTPQVAYRLMGTKEAKDIIQKPFTLVRASEYFLKDRSIRDNTISVYKGIITNVIVPFLKEKYKVNDIPLSQVRSRTAKEFKVYLERRKYKNSTINIYIGFVAAVITNIIEDYPIDENPSIGISSNPFANKKLRSMKGDNKILHFIDPALEDNLWALYYKTTGTDQTNILLALLIWNTGLSFVDLYQKIDFTRDIKNGYIFHYTRTKSGIQARVIVSPELHKVLDILKDRKHEFIDIYGFWLPIEFPYTQTRYVLFYRWCKNRLTKMLKTNVVISPHIIRHSFAVKQLTMGYSMDTVRIQMGHSSVSTTEKVYGYITNRKMLRERNMILSKSSINSKAN